MVRQALLEPDYAVEEAAACSRLEFLEYRIRDVHSARLALSYVQRAVGKIVFAGRNQVESPRFFLVVLRAA